MYWVAQSCRHHGDQAPLNALCFTDHQQPSPNFQPPHRRRRISGLLKGRRPTPGSGISASAIPDHPWVDTADGAGGSHRHEPVGELAGADATGGLALAEEQNTMPIPKMAKPTSRSARVSAASCPGPSPSEPMFPPGVALRSDFRNWPSWAPRSRRRWIHRHSMIKPWRSVLGARSRTRQQHSNCSATAATLQKFPVAPGRIDLYGMTETEVRDRFLKVFQHLLTR